MLAVIRIRGVTAIGNMISIALNGLMFGTIESSCIIGADRRSGVATTRCYTVSVLKIIGKSSLLSCFPIAFVSNSHVFFIFNLFMHSIFAKYVCFKICFQLC